MKYKQKEKMNKKGIYLAVFAYIIILFASCNSHKKIGYVKGIEKLTQEQLAQNKPQELKICINEALAITVNTTINSAVSVQFNLPLVPIMGNGLGGIQNTVGTQSYIVDQDGNLNFPILGKIKAEGKTRAELEKYITDAIYPKYITEEPIVTVRFVGYKIAVLGEVNRPGFHYFSTDKVNIFEVLTSAGDLTIYGKRDNVLLKRERADGTNEFIHINLQDKDLVLSPYFYLQQNDLLYIEPNKARGNSASIGATENLTISVVSVLASIATLLITVFK